MARKQPLHAVFCTLCICHKSWSTAGHAGTTGHHAYCIYNLECISQIMCIACTHVHARRRPWRALRRPRAAPADPGATSQHPQASSNPPGAASEPPRRPNGRNLATAAGTPNGTSDGAAQRPNDRQWVSAAALRAPVAPSTLPHAVPPSSVTCARLWRHLSGISVWHSGLLLPMQRPRANTTLIGNVATKIEAAPTLRLARMRWRSVSGEPTLLGALVPQMSPLRAHTGARDTCGVRRRVRMESGQGPRSRQGDCEPLQLSCTPPMKCHDQWEGASRRKARPVAHWSGHPSSPGPHEAAREHWYPQADLRAGPREPPRLSPPSRSRWNRPLSALSRPLAQCHALKEIGRCLLTLRITASCLCWRQK